MILTKEMQQGFRKALLSSVKVVSRGGLQGFQSLKRRGIMPLRGLQNFSTNLKGEQSHDVNA